MAVTAIKAVLSGCESPPFLPLPMAEWARIRGMG